MRIEAGARFLFAKVPIYKGFPIPFNESRLYGDSEMVTVEPFPFYPLYHLTKGMWGVHFLIIPRQRKKPEQLRSDLDFRAVLENKCDLPILVNNGLFNHHRPDGVVPVMHHFRLFLEGADIKCHLFILLASGGA